MKKPPLNEFTAMMAFIETAFELKGMPFSPEEKLEWYIKSLEKLGLNDLADEARQQSEKLHSSPTSSNTQQE
jgi:hypothetical protein